MPNSAAMKLRMSLFRHLEKLIELLGGPAPELVLKDSTPGKAKFVLSLDVSKIPRPTLSVLSTDQVLFSGDDPFSSEVAEHKAVMSVIKFLEAKFSLEIHDLSFSKIKTVELNIVHVVSGINSFTNRFLSFIMQYESSINLLVPFLSSSTQDSVMNGICQSLSDLCNVSHSSIDQIKEQLNILEHEVTLYSSSGSSSTSSNTPKSDPLVCKIFEKEFLSDILDLIGLAPAKYSTDVTESQLFIGICSIYLGRCYGPNPTGRSNIRGELKASSYDAESSAAAHAIRFLEISKKFEVVDFNHDSLILLREKQDSLLQLRWKYDSVVSEAFSSWTVFAESLQSFIDAQYVRSSSIFWDPEHLSEYESLVTFATGLQQVLYQIWIMKHNAISDFSSSVY